MSLPGSSEGEGVEILGTRGPDNCGSLRLIKKSRTVRVREGGEAWGKEKSLLERL